MIHVRWMIRRDMPEVRAIERESFEYPWSPDEFHEALAYRTTVGMVAEDSNRVVGFMVFMLGNTKLELWSLAVAADRRREGVGTALVEKLVSKLSERRRRITLEVRETNLPAQMFFRAQGFRAVRVLRGYWEDTAEDAYGMVYRVRSGEPATAGRV